MSDRRYTIVCADSKKIRERENKEEEEEEEKEKNYPNHNSIIKGQKCTSKKKNRFRLNFHVLI